jgi:serine/threonine-protein kinase
MQNIRINDVLAGRYRVEDNVGSGSFGAVFSALDQQNGERVAIKSLPPEGRALSETTVARFQREMKIISALVHRNIIGLYDFGRTPDGVFYMILEYVDGQSLESVVHRGPIAPARVVSICEQIGSALLLAHHRGIIHRDLKPANIMLVEEKDDYLVKVLDFGTAKLLHRIDDDSIDPLTREGMAVGTPRYIAPEQARGEQVGPWSDLYALGLLMYEMLTGARAVKADDVEGAVSAHVSPHPLELAEIELVPMSFRPVLNRLIAKDPRQRYRSADDLLADLDAIRFEMSDSMGGSSPHYDPLRARVAQPKAAQNQPAPVNSEHEPQRPNLNALSPAAQRRAQAKRVLEQSRNADSIEVDWEKRGNPAEPSFAAGPKKQRFDTPDHALFRIPDKPVEWVEACAAPLIALFCFMLFAAQLHAFDYPVRLGLTLAPTVLALAWSIMSGRGSWRYSFFRLWILFSLAVGFIAHAMGPRELITELFRSSTWFLEPFRDVPGMETFGEVLTWAMRWYAIFLSNLIEWGTNFIG